MWSIAARYSRSSTFAGPRNERQLTTPSRPPARIHWLSLLYEKVKCVSLTRIRCVTSLCGHEEIPMAYIHVIHENPAWLEPLADALERQTLPWRDWFLDHGVFDLSRPPPEGVFYNRMSASSHTRDHRYAAELTASVLAWLERHARRVINGSRALDLEISKARQYAALEAAGLRTPDTVLVAGKDLLVAAAQQHFAAGAFILKPNRGGKGLGVRLFYTLDALSTYIGGPDYEPPVDGLHLLQEYVQAQVPLITRAEFVGGRFVYAVEVDTSDGFELCPADACAVEDQPRAKFTIIDDVAGIEFITDTDGVRHTYDVNTNTNYNPEAEARAGRSGMNTLAQYLGAELSAIEIASSQRSSQ